MKNKENVLNFIENNIREHRYRTFFGIFVFKNGMIYIEEGRLYKFDINCLTENQIEQIYYYFLILKAGNGYLDKYGN
jgi:hypothetical protein